MSLDSMQVKELLKEISFTYIERRDELGKLDSMVGDGDHGISMERGARSGLEVISNMGDDCPVNEYFKAYGRAFTQTVGGAIGPLFGLIFSEFGLASKSRPLFDKQSYAQGIINATKKIMAFGGAKPGDKTMIDVMYPLSKDLENLNIDDFEFQELTKIAYVECLKYLELTKPLIAKKGRSKFLVEKSIGYQDAGATSFTYLIEKINDFLWREKDVVYK